MTDYYNKSAGTEGTDQANALINPDAPYIAAGLGQSGVSLPGFTPNSARAWWDAWFANPFDLRLVDPAALPGSLVLTAEQGAKAVAINKTVLPAPPSECAGIPVPPNPNLFEGSSTLAAIRQMQSLGNPSFPLFASGVTFPPDPRKVALTKKSVSPEKIATLRRYIANLKKSGRDPVKLVLYEARLKEYLER